MPAVLQLWFGALLLSFAPVFVKTLPSLGPTAVALYRCALAALVLLPTVAGRAQGPATPALRRRYLWLSLAAGLVFALDLWVWHRSVILAGAGLSTILANTQVFYLVAIGILLHGERPTSRFIAAVAMAAVGTYLLVDPAGHPYQPGGYWLGVGLGLLTGIIYATYVTVIKSLENLAYPCSLGFRLFSVSAATALFLGLFQLGEGHLNLPTAPQWAALFLLATVVQIGGWFFIQRSIRKVSVSQVGLLLLTQPVGATVWGVCFFGEPMKPIQIVGGAMTLFAVYLGNTRPRR